MGYPMNYQRVVRRNRLEGDYGGFTSPSLLGQAEEVSRKAGLKVTTDPAEHLRWSIGGDLRRLEEDTRDANHLAMYASLSGATIEQVDKIFQAFFSRV